MTLLQIGLFENILVAAQIEECKIKFTPADKIPLDNDSDDDPCCKE